MTWLLSTATGGQDVVRTEDKNDDPSPPLQVQYNLNPSGWFESKDRRAASCLLVVRGVLGNKYAGQHNLKTVQVREIMLK